MFAKIQRCRVDKSLVIVAVACISIIAFSVGYQIASTGLQTYDSFGNGDDVWDGSTVVDLVLKGDSIAVNSSRLEFLDKSRVIIRYAGTYKISGSLDDGQIIVDTINKGLVKLILNGVNIHCSTSAPICVLDADEAVIFLEAGTENIVSDGESYIFANSTENEPNAAIFSKTNLTISGDGLLKVIGNYNDGVASKDGVTIERGTIMVQSVDDGIRGKDYIVIHGGNLVLNVGGDGLKSDNAVNATKGYISVENGTLNIVSGGDAIQAEANVLISGGNFNITSGGGSVFVVGNVSAKGIKGNAGVTINGGVFVIDSADDAIHSNGDLIFNGGNLTLSSSDDAIHADGTVHVNGSHINVIKSFEGIEAAAVTIYNGNLHIASINDGIDVTMNMEIPNSGVIYVVNGVIGITSGGDAIQAAKDVLIAGGDFVLASGGGSNAVASFSSKGIKSGFGIVVNGGIFKISSSDDAIHSNGPIKLSQGSFVLYSSDDAVHADESVEINGGKINVMKSFEGIVGAFVTVNDGELSVISSDDGIDAGVLSIVKGSINIVSGGDAIQAENSVLITGGTFSLISGGGSVKVISGSVSAKGIKGVVNVRVEDGDFVIDSADDAIHSNGAIVINGGSFVISTGDDGIHADSSVKINAGEIKITKSYEGIEAPVITINGGNIHVVSNDDGVNLGVDSGMPRPGIGASQSLSTYSGSYYLYINGGYLAINSLGDGIDSNGAVVMSGGLVIVDGPYSNMNSALDHVAFNITGGMLFAVGSSGMALPPGNLSEQYSVMLSSELPIQAGTLFHVQTSNGTEVFTIKPTKQYQTVIFSLPSLTLGSTYEAYVGGNYTGTFNNGLGSGGTYIPGTKMFTFTITKKVTKIGPSGQFFPRFFPR